MPAAICNRLHPTTRLGYGFAVLEVQFKRARRFATKRRFSVLQPCAERTEERSLSSGFHDGTYRYRGIPVRDYPNYSPKCCGAISFSPICDKFASRAGSISIACHEDHAFSTLARPNPHENPYENRSAGFADSPLSRAWPGRARDFGVEGQNEHHDDGMAYGDGIRAFATRW